jgi:hypothetical protein
VYTLAIASVYTFRRRNVYTDRIHFMTNAKRVRKVVPVRMLRANLAKMLNAETATNVGLYSHVRAILVPVPNYRTWDNESRKSAMLEAERRFREAVDGLP